MRLYWYECDTCSKIHWGDANQYTPQQLAEIMEDWQQAGFRFWVDSE